jgi:hypothetical protein
MMKTGSAPFRFDEFDEAHLPLLMEGFDQQQDQIEVRFGTLHHGQLTMIIPFC